MFKSLFYGLFGLKIWNNLRVCLVGFMASLRASLVGFYGQFKGMFGWVLWPV